MEKVTIYHLAVQHPIGVFEEDKLVVLVIERVTRQFEKKKVKQNDDEKDQNNVDRFNPGGVFLFGHAAEFTPPYV